jgi:hypothetical protein
MRANGRVIRAWMDGPEIRCFQATGHPRSSSAACTTLHIAGR